MGKAVRGELVQGTGIWRYWAGRIWGVLGNFGRKLDATRLDGIWIEKNILLLFLFVGLCHFDIINSHNSPLPHGIPFANTRTRIEAREVGGSHSAGWSSWRTAV